MLSWMDFLVAVSAGTLLILVPVSLIATIRAERDPEGRR